MSRMRFIRFGLFFLALTLAACSSSATPRLIASSPQEKSYAPPPPGTSVIYSAYLEMEVTNPDRAADRAEKLSVDYGGYLSSSQSWYQEKDKLITVVLAVPAANFEGLKSALYNLGDVKSERITGQLISRGINQWSTYTEITVTLRPKSSAWPEFPSTGWNPLRTLGRAWEVFVTLFGFMADILIWALVVLGPFVLMALGVRALVRRARK